MIDLIRMNRNLMMRLIIRMIEFTVFDSNHLCSRGAVGLLVKNMHPWCTAFFLACCDFSFFCR